MGNKVFCLDISTTGMTTIRLTKPLSAITTFDGTMEVKAHEAFVQFFAWYDGVGDPEQYGPYKHLTESTYSLIERSHIVAVRFSIVEEEPTVMYNMPLVNK